MSLDAFSVVNAIDILVLVLAAIAFAGFWPGPGKPHRGPTAESLAAGIELFCQRVIDGLVAGRWDLGALTKVRMYLSKLFE